MERLATLYKSNELGDEQIQQLHISFNVTHTLTKNESPLIAEITLVLQPQVSRMSVHI